MEQIYYNGKDINTMSASQLLQSLQQTNIYKGLTQKQIVDQLGGKSVYILRPALSNMINKKYPQKSPQKSPKKSPQKSPQKSPKKSPKKSPILHKSDVPYLISDVEPLIYQHLDVKTARQINKNALTVTQARFEEQVKEQIYNFVIKNVAVYFKNNQLYRQFKYQQKEEIAQIPSSNIPFINIIIDKITTQDIYVMAKTMDINKTQGIYFDIHKLVFIKSIVPFEDYKQPLPIMYNGPNNEGYLYVYILNRFKEIYINFNAIYQAMGFYPEPFYGSYENFKQHQLTILNTTNQETINLLYYLANEINRKRLKISNAYDINITYLVSGFVLYHNKIILFSI
jgi:hypothetical protein